MASTPTPRTSPADLDGLVFQPARVPGTVAGALRGVLRQTHYDGEEHWFRRRFSKPAGWAEETISLHLDGIATIAEVWLNGQCILTSDSMFEAHRVDVTALLAADNELAIVCRSLTTALAQRRRARPTLRWRTKVVQEQQLRWFRTTLLGRAPGFAPGPEAVGPWRGVSLVRNRAVIQNWARKVSMEAGDGVVEVSFEIEGKKPVGGRLQVGEGVAEFQIDGQRLSAKCIIANPGRWWPHTHGQPELYRVSAVIEFDDGGAASYDDVPVGFREIAASLDPARDTGRGLARDQVEGGFALCVNGVTVFCRGVVWTPIDPVTLQSEPEALRRRLTLLCEAGINLIRVAGTAWYEDDGFHGLCDELGLLVWQDMMFANMDYPFGDPMFAARVRAEAETQCERLARHPSTAVLCGNSEIEQQVAMLGLAPEAGRGPFFGEELPSIAARLLPGVPYLPSAPCGGALPFRTNRGVANYFGVGAYLRPLEDARLADVRFASECLALSNVPEPEAIDELAAATHGGNSPTHPAWKRGIPRDAGVGWDFEDVRDHYLKLLFGVDAVALRYTSVERYFELSRLVTGQLMSDVFGEWRRPASPCQGGIILWCNDIVRGAGWGLFDHAGRPKAVYWFLKRALARVAVWMTGEGLNGVDVHVANDTGETIEASLQITLYQHGEKPVGQGSLAVELAAHSSATYSVEAIVGHFADASYAYRFGPAGHDVIAARLHLGSDTSGEMISQAFHLPQGHPVGQEPIERFGISGSCRSLGREVTLILKARRFAWGVRIAAKGLLPADQYLSLEPEIERTIVLRGEPVSNSIFISAANGEGRITVPVEVAIQVEPAA